MANQSLLERLPTIAAVLGGVLGAIVAFYIETQEAYLDEEDVIEGEFVVVQDEEPK